MKNEQTATPQTTIHQGKKAYSICTKALNLRYSPTQMVKPEHYYEDVDEKEAKGR